MADIIHLGCRKCFILKTINDFQFNQRNIRRHKRDIYCIECRKLIQNSYIKKTRQKKKPHLSGDIIYCG